MGYAKILWVYEDGVRDAEYSKERWAHLRPLVGAAVLQVCLGGTRGVRSASVGGHLNCVNFCLELHSADDALPLLWSRNRLRPLYDLSDEELALAQQLVAAEQARRAASET